jgi:hypothetical protein
MEIALNELRRGMPAKLWLGALDDNNNLLADPFLLFEGVTDTADIDENPEELKISIQAESRLIGLQKPQERRYTHEDQQIDFPGDLGFEYVAGLQDKDIVWG